MSRGQFDYGGMTCLGMGAMVGEVASAQFWLLHVQKSGLTKLSEFRLRDRAGYGVLILFVFLFDPTPPPSEVKVKRTSTSDTKVRRAPTLAQISTVRGSTNVYGSFTVWMLISMAS